MAVRDVVLEDERRTRPLNFRADGGIKGDEVDLASGRLRAAFVPCFFVKGEPLLGELEIARRAP